MKTFLDMLNGFLASAGVTGGARIAIMFLAGVSYVGYNDIGKMKNDFNDMRQNIEIIKVMQGDQHEAIAQIYSRLLGGIPLQNVPIPATGSFPPEASPQIPKR